jgi:hypothetical protein
MKLLRFAGALWLGALAGLLTGCSSWNLPTSYGPSYYDPDGPKAAIVSISDTNYPALLRGH